MKKFKNQKFGMPKKIKQKRFSSGNVKRGVSLAETIIAITVIIIVCTAAVSVVKVSTDIRVNVKTKQEALNLAANALECFKFAENEAEFQAAISYNNPTHIDGTNEYSYSEKNYTIIIRVNFDSESEMRDSFSAIGYDKNNKEIFNLSYEKE